MLDGETEKAVFGDKNIMVDLETPSISTVNTKNTTPSPLILIFVAIVKVSVFVAPGHAVDWDIRFTINDGA